MNVVFERLKQAPGAGVHFVKGRLSRAHLSDVEMLGKGEGSLVQLEDGKFAAYRDMEGELHLMSPVCQHLRCIVEWNSADGTWDCPCHGSSYDATGKVLRGPATRDLIPVSLDGS